jgi:hypothetical protein
MTWVGSSPVRRTKKNIIAEMRPARPTKLAAIQPTTTDVLVPPEEVGVALGVAEDAMLLVAGTILDSENVGTLLVGISTGVIDCKGVICVLI